jgi:uncharacterized protein (TIGR02444 family)
MDLWEFAQRVYGSAGVPEACLDLQARGIDVNMLLFCCWAGASVGVLPVSVLGEALAESDRWAESVVCPLRAVRSWMKWDGCALTDGDCMALCNRIKALELEAERLQHELLQRLTERVTPTPPRRPDVLDSVAANVAWYFNAVDMHSDLRSSRDLVTIICAVLPGRSVCQVEHKIESLRNHAKEQ